MDISARVCSSILQQDVCRRDGDRLVTVVDGINTTLVVGFTIGDTVAKDGESLDRGIGSCSAAQSWFPTSVFSSRLTVSQSAGDAGLFCVDGSFTSWVIQGVTLRSHQRDQHCGDFSPSQFEARVWSGCRGAGCDSSV